MMENRAQFKSLAAKRSTAQGVVTRHLNNIKRIIAGTDAEQVSNCKNQLEKLFNAKSRYDAFHESLLELGFLSSIDTADAERSGLAVSDDVIETCDRASVWLTTHDGRVPAGCQPPTELPAVKDNDVNALGERHNVVNVDWKERYDDLQRSHVAETSELRSMVSTLADKISDLTARINDLPSRAASTPTDTTRRVTFGTALDLTARPGAQAHYIHDAGEFDACERHLPHMTYGGHSSVSAVTSRAGNLPSSGPPPAHKGSYTCSRPLQAVPETHASPPYVCSSRTNGLHGRDQHHYPLDLSAAHRGAQDEGYPASRDITMSLQQRMLDQSESQHRSLLASVNATTAKLSKFDGNPLDYAPFINGFDELFDSVLDNPRAKLAALLNHCEGRALKMIRWCSHKSAAEGYAEARRTLRQKFGTPFVVSQAWLTKLLSYNSLRTPEELESFACDLVCCRESLECLGYVGELQCTNTLRLIVVKLPIHLRNRWRKVHRQSISDGRGDLLDQLIRLVQDAADDINDPAFSERAMEKVRNSYIPGGQQGARQPQPSQYRKGTTYTTHGDLIDLCDTADLGCEETSMATGCEKVTCSACSSTQHFTAKCRRYREKTSMEKLKFVQEMKLCTLCLSSNHSVDGCSLPWRCQEKGCKERHHTSLHAALTTRPNGDAGGSVNSLSIDSVKGAEGDAHCCLIGSMPYLPVTCVKVRSGMKEYNTYALLDNASTITLSTKRLSEQLNLSADEHCKINLNTVSSTTEVTGDIVSFDIKGVADTDYERVDKSLTVERLPVSLDHMARAEQLKSWDHLSRLCLPRMECDTIDLLIGQDNAHLLIPMESIVGDKRQPYAVRTPLGWTVYGVRNEDKRQHVVNTCVSRFAASSPPHVTAHVHGRDTHSASLQSISDDGIDTTNRTGRCYATSADEGSVPGTMLCDARNSAGKKCSNDADAAAIHMNNTELKEVLERFWRLDSFMSASRFTKDQQSVIELWEKEIKVVEGHIQLPIPYKKRPPGFPDNYTSALFSLKALGRRLKANPERLKRYQVAMSKNFTNRHAEYVAKGDRGRPGYTSYLTHHDVDHPRKPDVSRIVKSGKGKHKGVAMCELVFQGPDLMNQLNGVLLRFRQFEHASLADIEGMFNQVLVPAEERDTMRFLFWKNGDPDDEIVVCRMRTHIFGMVWSPAACMFALRKSAELFGKGVDEDILEAIRKEFYVDDWHNSEPTEDKAIRKSHGVDDVLARAGFNLTKHMSNSRTVLAAVPVEKRAKEVGVLDLSRDRLPKGVTLGLGWDPEDDSFHFRHVPEPRPETRRGLMSCVASLYDPLGIIAPFVLMAKLILQQACSEGAGWDDVLPDDVLRQWRLWLMDLDALAGLRIPRWLGASEDSRNTLHNFGDASNRAYGGASLLLTETVHGDFIDCRLVTAKSKLAPLRTQSIPRLELCASTVCVKMDGYLREELTVNLESSCFWSDSMLVLFYIMGDPANYKPFMANRVSFCHEFTRKQQWYHIPGELNPADIVSRGAGAEQLIKSTLLYHGPEFLKKGREAWPPRRVIKKLDEDTEVKKAKAVYAVTCMLTGTCDTSMNQDEAETMQLDALSMCTLDQIDSIKAEVKDTRRKAELTSMLYRLVDTAGDWRTLKQSISWLRRFALWYQSGWKGEPSISSIPRGAINSDEMKDAEIHLIKMSQRWHIDEQSIRTCRSMKQLDLVKVSGMWRVGGRLLNSSLCDDVKRPLLIPGSSAIARLIILDAHVRAMHPGVERTVMEVRMSFWVCQAKKLARSIIGKCVLCCRLRGRPAQQKMGNLPNKRVAFNTPPFFHTGVDLFGPLIVAVRRSTEKRYGVLYTCMSTRAVHIEVALDLTTSSFLCTFERFAARRGTPESLHSDNGKNFVGGKRELKETRDVLSDPRIAKVLAGKHIRWTMNTPAASHQGGIWERMIRTTRELLMIVLKGEIVTPDKLHTALCKIEHVINCRPITKLGDSPDSLDPITPCDILTLRPPHPVFPAKFSGERYRRDYKQATHLMNEFWKLWIKRYLPELQKRSKWHEQKKNCYVGELVILVQDQYHRCDWPLAVIKEVYPGSDGLVRNVLVKTKDGLFKRPIQKLVRLEGDALEDALDTG